MELFLSVVVPIYRSAATLPTLAQRLLLVLNRIGKSFEIIFVDDGSPDDSWKILSDLQRSHTEQIVAIQLMRNYGQHNALMCGFRHSQGKYIVTIDDDLQNPPEEIPKLLEAIEANGWDLVYGTSDTKQHSALRRMGSALVIGFFKLAFQSRIEGTSFRIIRRELVESIFPYTLNFTYIDGLLAWNTQRVGGISVAHHARPQGRSSYSTHKLVLMALNLFTNFSLLPLQIVSACGFLVATAGFLLGCYFLIQHLFANISVPGYASTMIVILLLGGIQLLALGVMGEYLGRLHLNVNRKPQYVERQVVVAQRDESDAASAQALDRFEGRADIAPKSYR